MIFEGCGARTEAVRDVWLYWGGTEVSGTKSTTSKIMSIFEKMMLSQTFKPRAKVDCREILWHGLG